MHLHMLGYGYWSYTNEVNEDAPEPTHQDFPAWEQATIITLLHKVLCAWSNALLYQRCQDIERGVGKTEIDFRRSTTARKLQPKQELNNVRQKCMLMAHYTSKIRDICNALGSNKSHEELWRIVHELKRAWITKVRWDWRRHDSHNWTNWWCSSAPCRPERCMKRS